MSTDTIEPTTDVEVPIEETPTEQDAPEVVEVEADDGGDPIDALFDEAFDGDTDDAHAESAAQGGPARDDKGRFKSSKNENDDTSTSDVAESDTESEGEKPDATPAPDAEVAADTEPAEATPPAPSFAVPVKIDGIEKSVDLGTMPEAERTALVEKGLSFDTVVERRQQAGYDKGAADMASAIREQGFGLETQYDPYTGQQKLVILPPQGADANGAPEGTAPAQPQSLATLDAELAQLQENIAAGEGDAKDFARALTLMQQRQQLVLQAGQQQSQQQKQAAAHQATVDRFNTTVTKIIQDGLPAIPGVDPQALGRDAYLYAVGVARSQKGITEAQVYDELRGYLARLSVQARPAPAPAPAPTRGTPAPAPTVGKGQAPGAAAEDPLRGITSIDDLPEEFLGGTY